MESSSRETVFWGSVSMEYAFADSGGSRTEYKLEKKKLRKIGKKVKI